ncbi:MAG: hypothetical protein ACTSO2_05760, partial [Promethearchaeota archaeon]
MTQFDKNFRKKFKSFFKNADIADFEQIRAELDLPKDFDDWTNMLKQINLDKYYVVLDDKICRNSVKTPYEKVIGLFKKFGRISLSYTVPIAISLVTGGAGLANAVIPFINHLKRYFKGKNIDLPENISGYIQELLNETDENLVDKLIESIFESNKGKSDPDKLKLDIQLGLKEIL